MSKKTKDKIGDISIYKTRFLRETQYAVVSDIIDNKHAKGHISMMVEGLDSARTLSLVLKICDKLNISTEEVWK